jgi:hypothetical protein
MEWMGPDRKSRKGERIGAERIGVDWKGLEGMGSSGAEWKRTDRIGAAVMERIGRDG